MPAKDLVVQSKWRWVIMARKPRRKRGGFRKKAPRLCEQLTIRVSWPMARDLDRYADELSKQTATPLSMNQALNALLLCGLRHQSVVTTGDHRYVREG